MYPSGSHHCLFSVLSFFFEHRGDGPCKIPDQFLKEGPDPERVPTRVTDPSKSKRSFKDT
jgi:hypothetical protein